VVLELLSYHVQPGTRLATRSDGRCDAGSRNGDGDAAAVGAVQAVGAWILAAASCCRRRIGPVAAGRPPCRYRHIQIAVLPMRSWPPLIRACRSSDHNGYGVPDIGPGLAILRLQRLVELPADSRHAAQPTAAHAPTPQKAGFFSTTAGGGLPGVAGRFAEAGISGQQGKQQQAQLKTWRTGRR